MAGRVVLVCGMNDFDSTLELPASRVGAWAMSPYGALRLTPDTSHLFEVRVSRGDGDDWHVSHAGRFLDRFGVWRDRLEDADVFTEREAVDRANRAVRGLLFEGRTVADLLAEQGQERALVGSLYR